MGVAGHVDVVQSGLDLVHDTERGGPHLQDGEVERYGHKRLFAAGEQGDDLQRLARRLDLDLYTAVEDILRILQLQGGLAAAEELREGLAEGLVDDGELLGKNGFHFGGDVRNDVLQLPLGLLHVVPLVPEVGIPLVDPLELVDGVQIDVAQARDGAFELPNPPLGLGDALQLHPLGPGRLVGELIGLPQLVQNLLLLQCGGDLFLLQYRDLPLHGEELGVLVPAVLVGPVPLSLQIQLFLVDAADGLIALPVLLPDGLEGGLLLQNLSGQLPVPLFQVLDELVALFPITGHIPAQSLQLVQRLLRGHALGVQAGQPHIELGDFGSDLPRLLLESALALRLALGLGPEGGGRPLQRLDAPAGVPGVLLGLGGALLELLQFGLLIVPLAAQVGQEHAVVAAALLQGENCVLVGALLGLGGLHLVLGGGDLPGCLLQRAAGLVQALPDADNLNVQPLQLIGTAEDARTAGHGAARHRAAGVEHLAVQRDDLEPASILAGDGNGLVHILRDNRPAQEAGKDPPVLPVKFNELVAHAHKACLVCHAPVPKLAGADGGEGQEGGPAGVPALEVLNGVLAVLLPLHHHVLHGGAERDLDGDGVLFRHMDEARHGAVDSPQLAALRLPHHQLHRLGVALVELLHLGEHVDAACQRAFLHLELDVLLLGLPGLLPAGFQAKGIAVYDVFEGIPVLPGLIQLLGGGLPLLFSLSEAAFTGGQFLPHGLVPVHQLLGRGGQGGEQGPGLGGGGGLHRLLLPQNLHLGGQGAGVPAGVLGGALPLPELGPEGLRLPDNTLQPFSTVLNLPGNAPGAALLGLQLPLEAVAVFQVILDIGLENGHGVLKTVGVGVPLHHLETDALGLHVLFPHLGGIALGGGIEGLHLGPGLRLLADGVFKIAQYLDGAGADFLQLLQPYGDLQSPQLVPEDEKFPCLLRLDPQRLHLELQLVNLIVDAHQILLRALQLALGLLLPVAEAGDACGLLKDLTAVGGFDGQDLVNFTLADDGVSLPAQARVHKELIHVLEADGAAVDVVLALAGAVVPPGHHDLALLHGEDMLGVVQYQRDLGEAQLLALGGAAEDDVLHLAPPERLGGLLAHHPADGVGDI